MKPFAGQRWTSESEPELGLGTITKTESGRVEIHFATADERRIYAVDSAPLRRVRFEKGDRIKTRAGGEHVVDAVEEKTGLLIYRSGAVTVPEAELSDAISFSKPEDRLLAGRVDDLDVFDLRTESLVRRARNRQSAARGFVGGRVDLLPHQMYIAGEVAARLVPRVLLADEVGLGKTIEAGLILHRLHLTGRASRVLVLVPEPLVHQWFVEMLRRFNLLFSLFDEERCESIEQHDAGVNPFLDSQLVICSTGFLAGSAERAAQAVAAGWDLLVVDEAHHLAWDAAEPGPEYRLVEALAGKSPGLLLLTATPQQLGPEGHFARLRLLDPDRYSDIAAFMAEAEHYEQAARAIDRVLSGKVLTKADRDYFGKKSARVRCGCEEIVAGDESARERVVAGLLDEFGTGRVMFRNTRAALRGFPVRKAELAELADDDIATRVKWLAALLKKLRTAKVLLICKARALVEDVAARLQREINVAAGVFHEGLTLLQRDRNAAFFAEEDGARILLCSEIGSEGRNFQFAHHLVLFDLPENPELLEQRIGRLDRIGQSATIRIHVPHAPGKVSGVLARWYQEGLGAFEKNVHGAAEIYADVVDELRAVLDDPDEGAVAALVKRTRDLKARVAKKLERGHDRLLELNSCKPAAAATLIDGIRELDADTEFEGFFIRLLDHFGVEVEDLAPRSYILKRGHLLSDAFTALREEGTSVTFDRARALSREDLGFASADHPLVRGSWDLLLGSEAGNSAYGVWKSDAGEAIFLEAWAVVECVAPAALHVERFLPALPIRIVVDHTLSEFAGKMGRLEKGDVFRLLDRGPMKQKLLPAMLGKATALAGERMKPLVSTALTAMDRQLAGEIERLEDLRAMNDHVRPEEVAALRAHRDALRAAITGARLRLDAVRMVLRTAAPERR